MPRGIPSSKPAASIISSRRRVAAKPRRVAVRRRSRSDCPFSYASEAERLVVSSLVEAAGVTPVTAVHHDRAEDRRPAGRERIHDPMNPQTNAINEIYEALLLATVDAMCTLPDDNTVTATFDHGVLALRNPNIPFGMAFRVQRGGRELVRAIGFASPRFLPAKSAARHKHMGEVPVVALLHIAAKKVEVLHLEALSSALATALADEYRYATAS